jgi:hypothetical protein
MGRVKNQSPVPKDVTVPALKNTLTKTVFPEVE